MTHPYKGNGTKDYVLVDKFGGTGNHSQVVGPFTFKDADDILRKGAQIAGTYSPNRGYHSKLPCWDVTDDYCWYMVRLDGDPGAPLDNLGDFI